MLLDIYNVNGFYFYSRRNYCVDKYFKTLFGKQTAANSLIFIKIHNYIFQVPSKSNEF